MGDLSAGDLDAYGELGVDRLVAIPDVRIDLAGLEDFVRRHAALVS